MLCMCLRRVVPWKPSLLAASSFVAQRHLCLSNKIVFCFFSSGMSLHFVWSFGRFTGISGFVFHSRCLLYYYLVMATINFFCASTWVVDVSWFKVLCCRILGYTWEYVRECAWVLRMLSPGFVSACLSARARIGPHCIIGDVLGSACVCSWVYVGMGGTWAHASLRLSAWVCLGPGALRGWRLVACA